MRACTLHSLILFMIVFTINLSGSVFLVSAGPSIFYREHGSLVFFLLKLGYHPGGSDHPNGTTVYPVSRAGLGRR